MNGQWIAYAYVDGFAEKTVCKYACKTEKETEEKRE